MNRTSRISIKGIARFVAVYLVLAVFLIWLGFLRGGTAESEPRVIAAAIALCGALVAATISALGLMLKYSIDERTLKSGEAAEARLRTETTLRAVELMSDPAASQFAKERVTGTLLALLSLGEQKLSLALTRGGLESGAVDIRTAVLVIDDILRGDDPALQESAASFLNEHHASLLTDKGPKFPECVYLKWRSRLSYSTRISLVETFLDILLAKPLSEWEGVYKNQILYCLFQVVASDPDYRVSVSAAQIIKQFIPECDEGRLDKGFLPPDRRTITYQEILSAAEKCIENAGGLEPHISQDLFDRSMNIGRLSDAESAFDSQTVRVLS